MIREWQARAELEERATAAELAAMRSRRTRQGDAPPRSDRLLRGCLIMVFALLAAVATLLLFVYAYTGTALPF